MLERIVRSSPAVLQTPRLGGVTEPPFFMLSPLQCFTAQQTCLKHMFFMMVTWDFWLQDSGHTASLQALGHTHPLESKTAPFKDLNLGLCYNTVVLLLPV